ncbi:hypothetical protein OIV83_005912 [Microbotryomycetes sp. JL201]|nr:hypothetical protein OIV83_005912 [Microbotryomycetes sp. JL201]
MTAADSSPPRHLALHAAVGNTRGSGSGHATAGRDPARAHSSSSHAAAFAQLAKRAIGTVPPVAFVARTIVRVVLSSLVGLLITVSVFVIMYRKPILYILFGDDKPPTLTEINTERNRSLDSSARATGFDYRRRQVLRNRFVVDADEESDAKSSTGVDSASTGSHFRVLSKPSPQAIKSCMRHPTSVTAAAQSTDRPTNSPKTVRLVDSDELDALEALRQFWAAPPTHGSTGMFHPPKGGIAGYRRTREIYMRGQAAPRSSSSSSSRPSDRDAKARSTLESLSGETVPLRVKTTVSHSSHLGERTSSPAGSPRLGYTRASSPPLGSQVFKGSALRSGSPHAVSACNARGSNRAGLANVPGRITPKRRTPSVSPGPSTPRLDSDGADSRIDHNSEKAMEGIVLPRWVKAKPGTTLASGPVKALSASGEVHNNDEDDDGFEDCSDRSGTSTPTGSGEILTPLTKFRLD